MYKSFLSSNSKFVHIQCLMIDTIFWIYDMGWRVLIYSPIRFISKSIFRHFLQRKFNARHTHSFCNRDLLHRQNYYSTSPLRCSQGSIYGFNWAKNWPFGCKWGRRPVLSNGGCLFCEFVMLFKCIFKITPRLTETSNDPFCENIGLANNIVFMR